MEFPACVLNLRSVVERNQLNLPVSDSRIQFFPYVKLIARYQGRPALSEVLPFVVSIQEAEYRGYLQSRRQKLVHHPH